MPIDNIKLFDYKGDEINRRDIKKSRDNEMVAVLGGKFYNYWLGDGEKAYGTNYIVHRCVSLLASNLAKLPFRVYKDDKPMPTDFLLPGGFDIRQPHPRMSLSALLYRCAVYYWYKGEFMSLIDEENPFSLEPVNPSQIKINKTEGTMIESWGMGKKIIPADKLIYANVFNPDIDGKISDRNRTLSPVKVVKAELRNYLSGREFNTQFFNNFAQVGLTLTDVEASTTREEREIIVRELDNTITAGNAWRTKCLPHGIDIADTKTATMKEMQLNEMFKDLRDIILGIYGVPRSVFGITNEAGLAQNTVDAEKRIMWTDTIQPGGFQFQEAFNQTLMKRFFPGYKLYFDYSDVKVLQDDILQKTNLGKSYRDLGYTTNEINDLFDLGMENKDDIELNTRYTPINLSSSAERMIEPEEDEKEVVEEPVDEKIVGICNLLEKTAEKKDIKIGVDSQRKYVSKLRGCYSKQLGKVLAIVKGGGSVNKTTHVCSELIDLFKTEKRVFTKTLSPMFDELKKVKDKDAGPAFVRVEMYAAAHYFRIKKVVCSEKTLEGKAVDIISIYKRLASKSKNIIRQEVSLWMEDK